MRFYSLIPIAAMAALAVADETETTDKPSDVLSLTSSTFESSVDPEPLMLVEFFAPWCGHCKALAPHYEEAATTLKEKNIKLAKVDCVEESELCQTHGVQGYPTLKVFRNGTPSEYSGPRKADGIVSYMVKQSLPAVSEVSTSNFDEFIKADKIVAIAYLPSSTESPAPEFSKVAEKHRDDWLFGLSTDASLLEKEGVKTPAIVVYRSFDEPKTVYPYPVSSAKEEDIAGFIKDLSIPVIDEVSGENYGTYVNSGKPLAYIFLDSTDPKKDEILADIKPVAKEYKSKVNFVWIDAVKFGEHGKALNLPEAKYPAFVIQEIDSQLKFPLDQSKEVSASVVGEYVKQYVSGKLEPSLKSEPIPEKQDESVYNLVGKEFDKVVFDDSKDVFLELYATWCGHCKRLKPTWDQLGDHFASIKDKVTIAKMEATENDLPPSVPFRVAGFPTIKFKAAGQRDFVDYEGDRSLEDLISFVEKNAKNNVSVPKKAEEPAQTPVETPAAAETPAASEPAAEPRDEL